jgi:hypothetical protein
MVYKNSGEAEHSAPDSMQLSVVSDTHNPPELQALTGSCWWLQRQSSVYDVRKRVVGVLSWGHDSSGVVRSQSGADDSITFVLG